MIDLSSFPLARRTFHLVMRSINLVILPVDFGLDVVPGR